MVSQGKGVIIILIVLAVIHIRRRIKLLPADKHPSVFIHIITVLIHPADLHYTQFIKEIPLFIDFFPAVLHRLTLTVKEVPDGIIGIRIAYLEPVLRNHNALGIDIILIINPAVHRHKPGTV